MKKTRTTSRGHCLQCSKNISSNETYSYEYVSKSEHTSLLTSDKEIGKLQMDAPESALRSTCLLGQAETSFAIDQLHHDLNRAPHPQKLCL